MMNDELIEDFAILPKRENLTNKLVRTNMIHYHICTLQIIKFT